MSISIWLNICKTIKVLGIEEVQTTEIEQRNGMSMRKKFQEHHAIIPTKTIPTPARFAKLSKLQQAIYLQVLRTTVAMFAADYIMKRRLSRRVITAIKAKSTGKIPLQQRVAGNLAHQVKKKKLRRFLLS